MQHGINALAFVGFYKSFCPMNIHERCPRHPIGIKPSIVTSDMYTQTPTAWAGAFEVGMYMGCYLSLSLPR